MSDTSDDVDTLDRDGQVLVAMRARVAERLAACRLLLRACGDSTDPDVAFERASLRLLIRELEPLAREIGIE